MSGKFWRKITVDGINYQYKIGRSNVVIRNKDTGYRKIVPIDNETLDYRQFGHPKGQVLPSDIVSFITGEPRKIKNCECGNPGSNRPHGCPFGEEIYRKPGHCNCCDECVEKCGDAI